MDQKPQYNGPERRKSPRLEANFVVSYSVKERLAEYDLTQTKDVSQGGLLLTTNRKFQAGTILSLYIRFPFVEQKIELSGEVIDSRELVKNLLYETRLRYVGFDEEFFRKLGQFIKENYK